MERLSDMTTNKWFVCPTCSLLGHVHMTTAKNSDFFDPPPPCLHFVIYSNLKIHATYLALFAFRGPPPALPEWTSYVNAPFQFQ